MNDFKNLLWAIGAIALAWLIYTLSPILMPFLVAALLAYLGDPITDRLEKRMPRTIAVVIVFVAIFTMVAITATLVLPVIERQLQSLIVRMPSYIDHLQNVVLPWVAQYLGEFDIHIGLENIKAAIRENWSTAGSVAAGVATSLSKSGAALFGWIASILLIPVLTFYLLRDWDLLMARIHELIPRRYEPMVVKLAKESDVVLGAFLRGQLLVIASLMIIYSVGLWLVGLEFSLLIGAIAGLFSFVPYLGFLLGIVVAMLVAIFQFQDVVMLAYVGIVFGVGQLLESFVLTPYLVGDRIGLHPVAVIFAVMAGGQLLGFTGVLIALPVAAVLLVVLRHAHERYVRSRLYDNTLHD